MRQNPKSKSTLCLGKHCVDLLYYYHSDHIGSSTFLTDALGRPYQFMLYLPFGEAMAQQKVAGWSTPYTFTGKEQDAATGLHYFGARYLDTRLSMWFGVDPLADKMPNWSSYAYAFNNPIRFIDPDGRAPNDIIIRQKKGDDRNSAQRTFNELQSLTSDKLRFDRKTGQVSIITGVGNENASSEGTKLVADLINDKKFKVTITNDVRGTEHDPSDIVINSFTIANDAESAANGSGTGSTILFSPDVKAKFTDINLEKVEAPANRVLAHELIHSDNNRTGTREHYKKPIGTGFPSTREEQKTIERENKIFLIQRYDGNNANKE